MNSCLIYLSFHLYFNKTWSKNSWISHKFKKKFKCVMFLSIILLRAAYQWPNTHKISHVIVWGIHLPDCLQQKEYIVYPLGETSELNHNLGEDDQQWHQICSPNMMIWYFLRDGVTSYWTDTCIVDNVSIVRNPYAQCIKIIFDIYVTLQNWTKSSLLKKKVNNPSNGSRVGQFFFCHFISGF